MNLFKRDKKPINSQPPEVGDVIYVDDCDLTNGTFVAGGKSTISAVRLTRGDVYVEVNEVPGTSWLWSSLRDQQKSLKTDRIAGDTMMRMKDGTIRPFGPRSQTDAPGHTRPAA